MKHFWNYVFFCSNAAYLTLAVLGFFGKLDTRAWFPAFCIWVAMDASWEMYQTSKEIVNEH